MKKIQDSTYFQKSLNSTEFNENMKAILFSNDLYLKLKTDRIDLHHDDDLPEGVKSVLSIYTKKYLSLVKGGKIKVCQ